MIRNWLGREWNEVKPQIKQLAKPYAFQITQPHGNIETWGNYRVVRVREFDDRLDIVLAQENFSRRS
ncbi:hypothetical protein Desor_4644 [Desulfosporosinus orientis DSM 765]|uniref:Uncharacterized protein n=1 Tax=Desulfosporosinus orientis (strain ATCC 19365 / DSM 765 / NCIMB 8382 / VKM B-1628 / Singapore I) TaxID=768706 RepID=G7WE72_DESOD|nr:hypothetical protein [Desulfosporosinus orientis]AET70048.1 hypothetical protein Desor_4644 [Desulfosporosinus orientis DSM 765]